MTLDKLNLITYLESYVKNFDVPLQLSDISDFGFPPELLDSRQLTFGQAIDLLTDEQIAEMLKGVVR